MQSTKAHLAAFLCAGFGAGTLYAIVFSMMTMLLHPPMSIRKCISHCETQRSTATKVAKSKSKQVAQSKARRAQLAARPL